MTSEPVSPHVNSMKTDLKVRFHEAQEHSSISPSPATSPSGSDNESSPGYKTPVGQLRRTHSHNGQTRHENTSNNAADNRHFLMQVRSHSSGSANTFVGHILTISPADELVFQPRGSGDPSDTITMTNTLHHPVAFKVKTTSPEKFRVRPSSGLIKPQKTEEVHVYLVSEPTENVNKEKFLIMAVDTKGDSGDANQLFKDTPKEMIMQHKLRCCLGSQNRLLGKNRSSANANATSSEEQQLIAAKNANGASTANQPSVAQGAQAAAQSDSHLPMVPLKGKASYYQGGSETTSTDSDYDEPVISRKMTKVSRAANSQGVEVEHVDAQTQYMRQQLNLLLLIQFLTAFFLLLIMLSYSCFGEDVFTRFLSLPFDFCHAAHGRRCT